MQERNTRSSGADRRRLTLRRRRSLGPLAATLAGGLGAFGVGASTVSAASPATAPDEDDDAALQDALGEDDPDDVVDLVVSDDDDDDAPDADVSDEAPEVSDDEAPKPRESDGTRTSASVSMGGAEATGPGKRKKKVASRKGCHTKPFDIFDCVPGNHTLEIGMHLGVFITAKNHGLFTGGEAPQPSLRRGNANIGWRILYLPIPYIGVGFETSVMPTRSPSQDVDANMWTVRGHVHGQAPWRLTPTFVMGGGFHGIRSQDPLLNSGDGFFYYGPGGKFYVNDWIALRLEARHLVSPNGANSKRVHHGEIFAAVDVTLPIGKWVERRRSRTHKDADGDGYPDKTDRCPNDYGEEDGGCPEGLDRDKDGVPDTRDKCPSQYGDGPGGCPIPDKDGDGILDSRDSCEDEPETYNGVEDADGCPDEEPEEVTAIVGVIDGIYFDSGRTSVKAGSAEVLDAAAATLAKFPALRLKIIGHTDDTGGHDSNVELSAERAEAVKAYLVGKGIDAARLETEGAGPDKPIADNGTKAGRATNRRIEFERLDDVARK